MTSSDPTCSDPDGQLTILGEIAELARGVNADLWLRGGWAMDFFLGRITRQHDDIDLFTLETQLVALDVTLQALGYRPTGNAPREQQRDYLRNGYDVSITPLRLSADGAPLVAGGRFQGEPWPTDMLRDAGSGELAGLKMRYIAPAAQIECKEMMPVWVPGFPRRTKDAEDIIAIRRALDRRS
jgi:hypothetical protein